MGDGGWCNLGVLSSQSCDGVKTSEWTPHGGLKRTVNAQAFSFWYDNDNNLKDKGQS